MAIDFTGVRKFCCDALNCKEFYSQDALLGEYKDEISDLQNQLQQKQAELQDLQNKYGDSQNSITFLNQEINTLKQKIDSLNSQLEKANVESDIERYYNTKISPIQVTYSGRVDPKTKGNVFIDVRNFYVNPEYDSKLQEIVYSYIKITQNDSNDDKIFKIQKWVRQNINYVSDQYNEGYNEYWQFPYETLLYRMGDCEDGAILMANLALAAGVPYWRVRINAGDVEYGGSVAGHAWMTYCRETDNKFVIIDWCYYPDINTPVKDKPYWKDVSMYKTIWFSFNKKYAFSDLKSMVYDEEEFKKFEGQKVN